MEKILTLATDTDNIISSETIEVIEDYLEIRFKIHWIEKEIACDLIPQKLNTDKNKDFIKKIEIICNKLKIDWSFQAVANRKKKLLFCDMDSTIIGQECIDEIGRYIGKYDKISEITEEAMRGKLTFNEALEKRVRMLKDVTEDQLEEIYKSSIKLNKGADTLISTMKKHSAHTVLISGGFTFFTSRIASQISFDEHYANELVFKEKKLTGELNLPILGSNEKYKKLIEISKKMNISNKDTVSIGDGANDIKMIEHSNLGIAYKAKPILKYYANSQINHTNLTSALYFQWFSKRDFSYTFD